MKYTEKQLDILYNLVELVNQSKKDMEESEADREDPIIVSLHETLEELAYATSYILMDELHILQGYLAFLLMEGTTFDILPSPPNISEQYLIQNTEDLVEALEDIYTTMGKVNHEEKAEEDNSKLTKMRTSQALSINGNTLADYAKISVLKEAKPADKILCDGWHSSSGVSLS